MASGELNGHYTGIKGPLLCHGLIKEIYILVDHHPPPQWIDIESNSEFYIPVD